MLAGAQAAPTWQALHAPRLQKRPEPQEVPSGTLPAEVQTADPLLQSNVFFTQGEAGSEQSAPALHVTHWPALHTWAAVLPPEEAPASPAVEAPQGVPSARDVVAWHVLVPLTHAKAPFWQSLGMQAPPGTHVTDVLPPSPPLPVLGGAASRVTVIASPRDWSARASAPTAAPVVASFAPPSGAVPAAPASGRLPPPTRIGGA